MKLRRLWLSIPVLFVLFLFARPSMFLAAVFHPTRFFPCDADITPLVRVHPKAPFTDLSSQLPLAFLDGHSEVTYPKRLVSGWKSWWKDANNGSGVSVMVSLEGTAEEAERGVDLFVGSKYEKVSRKGREGDCYYGICCWRQSQTDPEGGSAYRNEYSSEVYVAKGPLLIEIRETASNREQGRKNEVIRLIAAELAKR